MNEKKYAPIETRIEFALKLIAQRQSRAETARRLVAEFGYAIDTGKKDVDRAYQQLAEEDKHLRPFRKSVLRQTLETLLQYAIERRDVKNAIQCCRELAKIDGCYEAEKLVVNSFNADLAKMTSSERNKEIKRLFAKYASSTAESNAPGSNTVN